MQKNDILTLTIEEINNLGYGVGHTDAGQVVFVKDAVTGDVLDARIIKVTKNYLVARIETLHTPSALRTKNPCPARGCGGCVYQNITYEHEMDLKRQYVLSAFRKAGLSDVTVEAVQSTGALTGYRNKAQYPVANAKDGRMYAGFYAGGTHRVVPSQGCRLQPPVFDAILQDVCAFCDQNGIKAYDEECGKGLLRHIYLRMGATTGEIMLCLVVNGKTFPREKELADRLTERYPAIKSVILNVNEKNTNVVLGEDYHLVSGREYIEDVLCGVRFRISAGAFYQVNHDACELLYGIAKKKAALTGGETILDLYCGIGTIGLSMAGDAGKIIGIEIVEEAVLRAAENAERNNILNAYFYCGDASDAQKLLESAEAAHGDISGATVIMDPPRKGSTPELIHYLSGRNFGRIVYVSCGPDTLARDCALFRELGYTIGPVTPVDLFPRTGHVETVCLLSKLRADQHIEVELNLDEMDLTNAESKATYDEIKEYVLENTGLKVSQLYIAQIKRKYGIIERANYNLPKSENAKVPNCPPDKEAAIVEALKHFGMIK